MILKLGSMSMGMMQIEEAITLSGVLYCQKKKARQNASFLFFPFCIGNLNSLLYEVIQGDSSGIAFSFPILPSILYAIHVVTM